MRRPERSFEAEMRLTTPAYYPKKSFVFATIHPRRNVQRPTSNVQLPTRHYGAAFSMFGFGCWLLDVFPRFGFGCAELRGMSGQSGRVRSCRSVSAFTMVEIAISLGVIAIALVAILGVLP